MSVREITQTPLKPLEIRRDPCPSIRKVAFTFFISLATASFGVAIAFTFAKAVVVKFGGGAIGLIVGLVLSRYLLKKELPPIQEYRIRTLHQIAKDQPQLLSLTEKIKRVFIQKQIAFSWGAEHHELHDNITRITLSASMRERKGLKEVWKKFLQNSGGMELSYPQGPKHRLDFSMELERLEGKSIPLKVELLNPLSPTFEEDLKRIVHLEIDADGWSWPVEQDGREMGLRLRFSKKTPADQCILIRQGGSQELLGMLWYEVNQGGVHICSLARASKAAQMHIGNRLFEKLYEIIALDKQQITLNVRSKNLPAIQLYKNNFFEPVRIEKGYYHLPDDDAFLMRFNYAKYQAAQRKERVV